MAAATVSGEVRKFCREDGAVAVIISPDYGSEFSADSKHPQMAWDARLTEFLFMDNPTQPEFQARIRDCGYGEVYLGEFGSFEQLKIVWVPAGRPFRVIEYDGAESIEYLDMSKWTTF